MKSSNFVCRQKNIRTNFSLSVLLFLCLFFSSCERRELTYYEKSEIIVTADWSESGLSEDEQVRGATLVFYPQDGGTPFIFRMGDRTQEIVRLPEGIYNIILFNRSFDDFGNLAFRGQEKFETLEAYAKKVETRTDENSRTETRIIIGTPDELAAGTMEGFTVTEEMLGNYSKTTYGRSGNVVGTDSYTLHLIPQKLTRKVIANIRVNGLNNIRTATCRLDGVAESVFLATGKPAAQHATQEFALTDLRFDEGSYFEGRMTGQFETFGIRTGDDCNLRLDALLVDGKTTFTENYTNAKVSEKEDGEGVINIYVEVSTGKVPDVKPEGGSDSGFDVDVDGWGDDVETDFPIE